MENHEQSRLGAIDALRGIAALWVALYHFYNASGAGEATMPLGPLMHWALSIGGIAGVHIFFVLSGFVIARNLSKYDVTGGVVARFALRRSIRLDPTYWTVIMGVLVVEAAMAQFDEINKSERTTHLSALIVIANLLYLDNLLKMHSIVTVGWTLCLEIQFYLVFAAAEWLAWRFRSADSSSLMVRCAAMTVLFIGSLAFLISPLIAGTDGEALKAERFFIDYWYAFFLGVLCCWAFDGVVLRRTLYASVAIVSLAGASLIGRGAYGSAIAAFIAVLTAVFIDRLGAYGLLTRKFGPLFQHLGRISYSLYLVHPLGSQSLRLLHRHFDIRLGEAAFETAMWMAAALVLSLIGAQILYQCIERPTHQLSRRISLEPKDPLILVNRR